MVPISVGHRVQNPSVDVAALTNIQPEMIPLGCLALVVANHKLYEWRRDSIDAADGNTIVANAKGAGHPGRWHQLSGIPGPAGAPGAPGAAGPPGPVPAGTAAGEILVWDTGTAAWVPISTSTSGLDLQAQPLSNFRDARGNVTLIAAGAGDVALNLNAATASLALASILPADVSRPVGLRVQWWQDVSPLVEQWTDDFVVSCYRSAANLVILSDASGTSASGAATATLALTGGSGATYEVTVDTGTGLLTATMAQAATARRAIATVWLADPLAVTVT